MKLIAKKPCSFGGKAFFINDEIPVNAVLNPKQQEELGVLSIVSDGEAATGILETGFQETDIAIPVFKSYDGDTAQVMGIPLNAGGNTGSILYHADERRGSYEGNRSRKI
ncbi:MAG: hypothetical protein ACLUTU_02695 [Blautia faecis]